MNERKNPNLQKSWLSKKRVTSLRDKDNLRMKRNKNEFEY